jgi:hypothetical protein
MRCWNIYRSLWQASLRNVDDVLENTWGNRKVFVHPEDVLNNWDFDRRKILVSKMPFL